MGLAHKHLYVTNTRDKSGYIIMTGDWKPEQNEDGNWFMPGGVPIGVDMWIPNIIDLEINKQIEVKIVPSEKETGLWLICYDDYFGDEQHIYNFKPRFIEGTDRIDAKYNNHMMMSEEIEENYWGIHVWSDIKMVHGDGPIPVTLIEGHWEPEIPRKYIKEESFNIFKWIKSLFKR
jgi:hypothetical protein